MVAHLELKDRIEAAYKQRGDHLGWRFLYSPLTTLDRARIALIGLNPGGSIVDPDHAQFAMPSGSAYRDESWAGHAAGESPLQRQILLLFERLGLPRSRAEEVLAGNLVPFRSPDWNSLSDRPGALSFGKSLWHEALASARPTVIITLGTFAYEAISDSIRAHRATIFDIAWGNMGARRAQAPNGTTLIGLPHLSRFAIMGTPARKEKLDALFDGLG